MRTAIGLATPGTMDWGKLLLGLFRIGMVVALIWLIRHFMRKKAPKGVLIGFGLILAGAIGNIIDRIWRGQVVDFLLVHWADRWYFPAFNAADSAITVGAVLLVLDELLRVRKSD